MAPARCSLTLLEGYWKKGKNSYDWTETSWSTEAESGSHSYDTSLTWMDRSRQLGRTTEGGIHSGFHQVHCEQQARHTGDRGLRCSRER